MGQMALAFAHAVAEVDELVDVVAVVSVVVLQMKHRRQAPT